MPMRFTKRIGGRGVGLVALAVVLIVAVAACGDSGGETPTSAPTPTPEVEITISPFFNATESMAGLVKHYGKITGTLAYEGEWDLPEGTGIVVLVYHPEGEAQFSGYYTLERTEQFPVSFVMHCDPCVVDAGEVLFASVSISGLTGPPRQDGLVETGSFRFLNAIKTIVIDSNGLAEDIEIPVVPQPTLTGTIEPGEGETTPADLAVWVGLWDISQRDSAPILVTSKRIEVEEQFPIPFSINYYPEDIDPNGTYVLQAELMRFGGRACQGPYRHEELYEVITGDNPTHGIQLKIVQADKWVSEELAYVTGTVTYANPYEDMEPDSSSENGDTNPNSKYGDTNYRFIESDEDIPADTGWTWFSSKVNILPLHDPDNPWHLGIIDLSEDCTLAEIQIDGSIPLPFSFSIPFYSSHVDPDSDYAIRARDVLYLDRYLGRFFAGETPIRLNPNNPGSHVEIVVHELIRARIQ